MQVRVRGESGCKRLGSWFKTLDLRFDTNPGYTCGRLAEEALGKYRFLQDIMANGGKKVVEKW